MRSRRILSFLAVPVLACSLAIVSSGAAQALPSTSSVVDPAAELALQAQEADARGYLILDRDAGERVGDAIFYPTGPVSDQTLVVIADPDGSLPNGLTEEKLGQAAQVQRSGPSHADETASPLAASSYAWSASSSGYSQPFQGGSAIGWDDSATVSYYFYTNPGYNQRASGQGLGFYRGYNGSQFGTWQRYYYVGTGGSTGAGSSVPWGNTAATKYFKAICTQTTFCGGYFQ